MDDETKLTLHGLKQHFVQLADSAKNRKLFDLLDSLDFNQVCRHDVDILILMVTIAHLAQVIIFVKSTARCNALNKLLNEHKFPSIAMNGAMDQTERCVCGCLPCTLTFPHNHLFHFSLANYNLFKEFKKRILVATDIFGRGMDIERVNIVINYDMPENSDTYLHRVRAFAY